VLNEVVDKVVMTVVAGEVALVLSSWLDCSSEAKECSTLRLVALFFFPAEVCAEISLRAFSRALRCGKRRGGIG
jgi:hypothetical protein